jgi:hypothetical protein
MNPADVSSMNNERIFILPESLTFPFQPVVSRVEPHHRPVKFKEFPGLSPRNLFKIPEGTDAELS